MEHPFQAGQIVWVEKADKCDHHLFSIYGNQDSAWVDNLRRPGGKCCECSWDSVLIDPQEVEHRTVAEAIQRQLNQLNEWTAKLALDQPALWTGRLQAWLSAEGNLLLDHIPPKVERLRLLVAGLDMAPQLGSIDQN